MSIISVAYRMPSVQHRKARRLRFHYRITQQPLLPSRRVLPPLGLLPLAASSSSTISWGRMVMWTTLGASLLNWYSVLRFLVSRDSSTAGK